MKPPVRIIGIGSPWGDDALGLEAAAILQERLDPRHAEVSALDRPGATLLSRLQDAGQVILLDAVRQDQPPGTLIRLEGQELAGLRPGAVSSHGIGVAEVLGLARSLGAMPRTMVLWGMEPSCLCPGPCSGLSETASSALPRLVAAVLEEVRQMRSCCPA